MPFHRRLFLAAGAVVAGLFIVAYLFAGGGPAARAAAQLARDAERAAADTEHAASHALDVERAATDALVDARARARAAAEVADTERAAALLLGFAPPDDDLPADWETVFSSIESGDVAPVKEILIGGAPASERETIAATVDTLDADAFRRGLEYWVRERLGAIRSEARRSLDEDMPALLVRALRADRAALLLWAFAAPSSDANCPFELIDVPPDFTKVASAVESGDLVALKELLTGAAPAGERDAIEAAVDTLDAAAFRDALNDWRMERQHAQPCAP